MNLNRNLLILLILLFPFGQLTRFSVFKPEIIIYLHDLVILILVIFNLRRIYQNLKKRQIIGFLIACIFSLILSKKYLNNSQIIFSSLYLFRFISYISIFFIDKNNAKKLQPYFLTAITVSLLFSFIQYLFFPSLEPLFAAGWDRHYFRLTGTWFDANFTGLIYILFIAYLSYIKNKYKYIYVLISLSIIAIILTYSRSSILVLLILITKKYFNKNRKLLYTFIFIILLSIFLLPQKFGESTNLLRTSTVLSRINNWQESLNLFTKNPIFGFGFNTLRYIRKNLNLSDEKWEVSHSNSGTDNSLIYLLLTTGLFGTYQFTNLIKYLKNKTKNYKLFTDYLLVIFIHGMFTNSWFYPWILIWFFITI